jgi:hypothetical protein
LNSNGAELLAKKIPSSERKKVEDLLDGTTGTKDRALNMELIKQAIASLWIPEGISEYDKLNRMRSAIALLKGINPTDEIERLLATQMVATHNTAMECLRRAMIQNQTFEGRNQDLKNAAKLMGIYTRQIDALNKHRGKGQQKVTVEHVHVEAGAHAVVGSVHATPRSDAPPTKAPVALAHAPGQTLETTVKKRAPVHRRKK